MKTKKKKLKPDAVKVSAPAKKTEALDLREIPGSNSFVRTSLKPKKDSVFPPDPATEFTPTELKCDTATDLYWQIKDIVSARFPQMLLRRVDKGHTVKTMAFIDESYECNSPPIGGISPPTWMDPCVFTQFVLEDAEVKAAIDAAIKKNSEHAVKQVEERLIKLLQEYYVPYLTAQFATVKTTMARWLIASTIWDNPAYDKYRPSDKK